MRNKVVYTHSNPKSGEVFYVGYGSPRRPYELYVGKRTRSKEWADYVKLHGKPIVNIIKEGLSKEEAIELEMIITETYGVDNLVNSKVGNKHSEDFKNSMKGENNHFYGVVTNHFKELRKSQVGSKNPAARAVIRYSLDGVFEKEYSYIKEAEQDGYKSVNIRQCVTGRAKTSGGKIWKYK